MLCQRCDKRTAEYRIWSELVTMVVCRFCAQIAIQFEFWVDELKDYETGKEETK